jgi:hypothetical protein
LSAPFIAITARFPDLGLMNHDDNGQSPNRFSAKEVTLPPGIGSLSHSAAHGNTLRVEGTNVIRVPFGVRQPRRRRPERPERWATLVLPFQVNGGPNPTPPQAA